MLRHHCKTCGNPLHGDDTHAECVSRLGKCSHCECFSLASLRSWLAFFSESDSTLAPSSFFPPRNLWEKNSGQRIWAAGDKRAHVGLMPTCLAVTAEERAFARPLHSTWSASLRCEWHDLIRCEWWRNRRQPFLWRLLMRKELSGSVTDPTLLPSPMRTSSESWQRLSMSSGSNGLHWGAIPLEGPLMAKARRDPRHGAEKEGCDARRFQQGLRSAVRVQTDLRSLVRKGVGPAHQCRNCQWSGLSILPAGYTGTPCASVLRQQVRGVAASASFRSESAR